MSGRHSSACIENSCPGGRFEFNVCVMSALWFPFIGFYCSILAKSTAIPLKHESDTHRSSLFQWLRIPNPVPDSSGRVPFGFTWPSTVGNNQRRLWEIHRQAATTWRSEQHAGVIRPESHQLTRLYFRTVCYFTCSPTIHFPPILPTTRIHC